MGNSTAVTAFAFTAFSIVCNLAVVLMLYRMKIKSLSSKALLYLHITQIVDNLTILPGIYSHASDLCAIMGFIHFYSRFGNANASAALIYLLQKFLFNSEDFEAKYRGTYRRYL